MFFSFSHQTCVRVSAGLTIFWRESQAATPAPHSMQDRIRAAPQVGQGETEALLMLFSFCLAPVERGHECYATIPENSAPKIKD